MQFYQSIGAAIPMFLDLAMLFYVCQRFAAARNARRKILAKMRDFATIVSRARDNLSYIGERVSKGMDEMKGDVGRELRITDRLTTQTAKLATVLNRFASLEETVIELVRMERDRENARIETPIDVADEIERAVRAADKRDDDGSAALPRNPLSKFSTCTPAREAAATRIRIAATTTTTTTTTTPEVRLLGEPNARPSK